MATKTFSDPEIPMVPQGADYVAPEEDTISMVPMGAPLAAHGIVQSPNRDEVLLEMAAANTTFPKDTGEWGNEIERVANMKERVALQGPWPDYYAIWERKRAEDLAHMNTQIDELLAGGHVDEAENGFHFLNGLTEAKPNKTQVRRAVAEEALANTVAADAPTSLTIEEITERLENIARVKANGAVLDQAITEMMSELAEDADWTDHVMDFIWDMVPGSDKMAAMKYLDQVTEGQSDSFLGYHRRLLDPTNSGSTMQAMQALRLTFMAMAPDELDASLTALKEANFGFWGAVNNPASTMAFLVALQGYSSSDAAYDIAQGIVDLTVIGDTFYLMGAVAKGARNAKAIERIMGKKKPADMVASDLGKDTATSGLSSGGRVDSASTMQPDASPMHSDSLRGASPDVQERLIEQARVLREALKLELETAGMKADEVAASMAAWDAENYAPEVQKGLRAVVLADETRPGEMFWVDTRTGTSFKTEAAARGWARRWGLKDSDYDLIPIQDGSQAVLPPDPLEIPIDPNMAEEWKYRLAQSERMQRLDALADEVDLGGDVPGMPELTISEHQSELTFSMNHLSSKLDTFPEDLAQMLHPELHVDRITLQEQLADVRIATNNLRQDPNPSRIRQLYKAVGELNEETFKLDAAYKAAAERKLIDTRTRLGGTGQDSLVSPSLAPLSKLVDDIREIFGMSGESIIVTAGDAKKLGLELFDGLGTRMASKKGIRGTATTIRHENNQLTHAIILQDTDIKNMGLTLTHEMGHSFSNEFLVGLNPALKKDMLADYLVWLGKKDAGDFKAFLGARNTPGFFTATNSVTGKTRLDLIKDGTLSKYKELSPAMRKWEEKFEEYFADQFSKFVATDKAPRTALEKAFKELADWIKASYKKVNEVLGFDASAPQAGTVKFFQEHIKQIRAGTLVERNQGFLKELDFSGDIPFNPKADRARLHDMMDNEIGDTTGMTIRTRFDANDTGPYGPLPGTLGSDWLFDPRSTIAPELYDDAVVASFRSKAVLKAFSDFLKPSIKGLSKHDLAQVEGLLRRGDQYEPLGNGVYKGKEFTFAEARAEGLTGPQAEAYVSVRMLRRQMFELRDRVTTHSLREQGYKDIKLLKTPSNINVAARHVDWETGMQTVEDARIFDATSGVVRRMTPEEINRLKDSGHKLMRLKSDRIFNEDLGASRHIIVKDASDHTQDELTRSMGFRPGEMSRIYDDEYFIRQHGTSNVDGIATEVDDVIMTARSAKEAGQYIDDMNTALRLFRANRSMSPADLENLIEASMKSDAIDVTTFMSEATLGAYDDITEYTWKYNRAIDEFVEDSIEHSTMTGGQYTGHRGPRLKRAFEHKIGNAGQIIDPWASLSAETANLSRFASTAQTRERHMAKFVHTFNSIIPDELKVADDPLETYLNIMNEDLSAGGTKLAFQAESNKKYLNGMLGQPDKWERKAGYMMRRLSEEVGLDHWPMVGMTGKALRRASPIDFFRALTFDVSLGLFNIAQTFVQGNGGWVAMAAHPVHGLKAAKSYGLYRIALMSDNPEVWKQVAGMDKLSNLGLSSTGEFVDAIKAIRQYGLIDDLTSTVLHTKRGGGGLVINESMVSKIRRGGRFFYNRGEEFSRMVSFDVARRDYLTRFPGANILDPSAQKAIMAKADDLLLNMTEVNKAAWQKGPLALPAQFLQYNLKLANQVFRSAAGKGQFTRAQSAQMIAAHLALYGAGGTGISKLVEEGMGWFMSDNEIQAMDEGTKLAIAEGMIARLIYAIDGSMISVGKRLGAGEFYERIVSSLTDGTSSTVVEALSGPTGAGLSRVKDSVERLTTLASTGVLGIQDAPAEVLDVLSDVVSSMKSASKAYMWHQFNMRSMDSRGNPTTAAGGVTRGEILGRLFGFETQRNTDTWTWFDTKKEHDQHVKEIAQKVHQLRKDSLYWHMVGRKGGITKTETEGNAAYRTANIRQLAAQLLVSELDVGTRLKVETYIRDELGVHDSQFQKLATDLLMRDDKYKLPMMPTKAAEVEYPDLIPARD